MSITTSPEIILDIANNKIEENFLAIAGYANWSKKSLINEIKNNDWIYSNFSNKISFEKDNKLKWYKVLNSIGSDFYTNCQHVRAMHKKLVGIDYGKVFVGIAVGQTITHTTTPITIIKITNNKFNWIRLDKIISQWHPTAFILGLPVYNLKIKTNIEEIIQFSRIIKHRYKIPVHFINEAFSTCEVWWRLKNIKKNNGIKKLKVDDFAACIILETWMSQNKKPIYARKE